MHIASMINSNGYFIIYIVYMALCCVYISTYLREKFKKRRIDIKRKKERNRIKNVERIKTYMARKNNNEEKMNL